MVSRVCWMGRVLHGGRHHCFMSCNHSNRHVHLVATSGGKGNSCHSQSAGSNLSDNKQNNSQHSIKIIEGTTKTKNTKQDKCITKYMRIKNTERPHICKRVEQSKSKPCSSGQTAVGTSYLCTSIYS